MTQKIDELKQDRHNALFLFQQGYGLIGIPLNLFNFASITYYLVVTNIPLFLSIFPNFSIFLGVGVVVGPLACIILGLIYVKSSQFRANWKIIASANPYTFKLMPSQIPLYTAVAKLCEKEGLKDEAFELKRLIEDSYSIE